jgi:hypothetical protein
MPHELRPDEIDRRERALRAPKDSSVTSAIRGALGSGVRSTGTPITDRTIIDAAPLHTRRDAPPPEAPDPDAGAAVAHAIRAASGTPVQKARAKAQGAQGGAAAGGPTVEEEEAEAKKPNRRPAKKRSKAPEPVRKAGTPGDWDRVAKALRAEPNGVRTGWVGALAERQADRLRKAAPRRHAAMTAGRPQ